MFKRWLELRLKLVELLVCERVSRTTDQCHPINFATLQRLQAQQKEVIEEIKQIEAVRENHSSRMFD